MENINTEFLKLFKICNTIAEVKEFIKIHNPNIHYVDDDKNNAFIYSCSYNKDINMIRFLVSELKIDTHRRNKNGNNGLHVACKSNPCLDIIKYLIEEQNMSLYSKNEADLNPFLIACMRNANTEIIKYLYNQYTDIDYVNQYNINGLLYACMRNQNPEIIKCLITDIGIDPSYTDVYGNNGFLLACKKNINIEIIKILIELDYDIYYQNVMNSNGLACACLSNNDSVIKYLIEETELCIQFLMTTTMITTQIVDNIKKLDHCFQYIYSPDFNNSKKLMVIKYLIEKGWTEYINNQRLYLTSIDEIEYKDIELILPFIDYEIEIVLEKKSKLWEIPYFENSLVNFRNTKLNEKEVIGLDDIEIIEDIEKPELDFLCKCFFKDEEIDYYGHRIIVFNIIPVFNKMICFGGKEKKDGIVLHLDINPKVFEEYLKICYTGMLDIDNWDIKDLTDFIGLIDIYENKIFNVNDIEAYVIDKIKEEDEFLEKMVRDYKMKHALIAVNNIKVQKKEIERIDKENKIRFGI